MPQTLVSVAVGAAMLCGTSFSVGAQDARVTAQVQIVAKSAAKPAATHAAHSSSADVVIWLEPIDSDGKPIASAIDPPRDVQLVQRNKTFEPHVVVVPVGTVVQFPNKDPFFHNVFSLFDGKRFDLGLYEAGSSKPLRFDRPGVSFLFCNIHPEMSAVVVVVQTPYFAKSDRSGRISIAGVPDGRYRLRVWYERSAPEDLRKLDRAVVISTDSRALGEFRVPEDPNATLAHKNKYGQDYPPPANGIYH
jgi:plastocyanin